MAHPFFDALRYPWHRPEAARLHQVLTQAQHNPQGIDALYQRCAANLPFLTLTMAPALIWKEALENLVAASALRNLCDIVRNEGAFQNNATIQATVQAVLSAQPAVEQRIIDGDLLVLDRNDLRQQLMLLESSTNPVKVLLVRGEPRSGKSHGFLLFERAAEDKGALTVYVCEGIVATVEELVALLFSTLEASDKIPESNTSAEAWYRAVCIQLLEVAARQEQPLWIAVDDLGPGPDGAPILDTEIRKFCEQFALNMMNPAFSKWFRLMLIHYPDGPVPTRWKSRIWREDRTQVADIRPEHVGELLELWLVAHNRTLIQAEQEKFVNDVLADVDALLAQSADNSPRLELLHNTLALKLKTLVESEPLETE